MLATEFIDMLEILLRAFSSLIVLFILAELMGKKQISQLTFFDYVVGITIGSISAEMATAKELPFYISLIAMSVYSFVSILISYLSSKSIKARHILTGSPLVLIEKGKILQKNLERSKLDINDLLRECRTSGYFNVNDIEYAVMEVSGRISFLPVSNKRPLTPEDMKIAPEQEDVVANVIIDGKLMAQNLKHAGKNEEWLNSKLKEQNIKLKDVMLGTCDQNDNFKALMKYEKSHKNTVFE